MVTPQDSKLYFQLHCSTELEKVRERWLIF